MKGRTDNSIMLVPGVVSQEMFGTEGEGTHLHVTIVDRSGVWGEEGTEGGGDELTCTTRGRRGEGL